MPERPPDDPAGQRFGQPVDPAEPDADLSRLADLEDPRPTPRSGQPPPEPAAAMPEPAPVVSEPAAALTPPPGSATADSAPTDAATADLGTAGSEPVSLVKAGDTASSDPNAATRSARHTPSRRRRANKSRRKAPWWEFPALIVLAVIIAVLVKSFILQPFYIPSESMEKTLAGSAQMGHDRILVNKLVYDFRDPHPGDIVVFHAPPGWDEGQPSKPPSNLILKGIRGLGQLIGFVPPDGQIIVKRVIATGGQTVRGFRAAPNGQRCTDDYLAAHPNTTCQDVVQISVRGASGPWRTLDEPFVYGGNADTASGMFGPVTVPKGRLWVMGDHRNNSADSRYHCDPAAQGQFVNAGADCDAVESTVPIHDVIGKAIVVAWPPSHWRTLGTPSTFASATWPGTPSAIGLVTIVPLYFVRRRRRRRRPVDG